MSFVWRSRHPDESIHALALCCFHVDKVDLALQCFFSPSLVFALPFAAWPCNDVLASLVDRLGTLEDRLCTLEDRVYQLCGTRNWDGQDYGQTCVITLVSWLNHCGQALDLGLGQWRNSLKASLPTLPLLRIRCFRVAVG